MAEPQYKTLFEEVFKEDYGKPDVANLVQGTPPQCYLQRAAKTDFIGKAVEHLLVIFYIYI